MKSEVQMMTKLLITLLAGLSLSCGTIFEKEVPTKGRAAYQEWPNKKLVDIIIDSTWRKIELKGDSTKEYSGLILANTSDEFLVIEYSKSKVYPTGRTVEGDIVKMNLKGEVIDKILDCEQGKLTGNLALSKNDSKLLFTLQHDYFNPDDPIGQLNRPVNIYIMNYKTRDIIKRIDTIGLSLNAWINDSPWLSDETRFIYDFRTDRQIKMANDTSKSTPARQPGIYLYDLAKNKQTLLIDGGYSGEVSPTADKIAFLKDKKVCVYDITTKTTEILYTLSSNERTAYVDWTPDGEYVFFRRFKDYPLTLFTSSPTLIRLSDKKVMRVKTGDLFKANDV
jgi:Tol biopolymer transport system component